jgi:hypothetical protein
MDPGIVKSDVHIRTSFLLSSKCIWPKATPKSRSSSSDTITVSTAAASTERLKHISLTSFSGVDTNTRDPSRKPVPATKIVPRGVCVWIYYYASKCVYRCIYIYIYIYVYIYIYMNISVCKHTHKRTHIHIIIHSTYVSIIVYRCINIYIYMYIYICIYIFIYIHIYLYTYIYIYTCIYIYIYTYFSIIVFRSHSTGEDVPEEHRPIHPYTHQTRVQILPDEFTHLICMTTQTAYKRPSRGIVHLNIRTVHRSQEMPTIRILEGRTISADYSASDFYLIDQNWKYVDFRCESYRQIHTLCECIYTCIYMYICVHIKHLHDYMHKSIHTYISITNMYT